MIVWVNLRFRRSRTAFAICSFALVFGMVFFLHGCSRNKISGGLSLQEGVKPILELFHGAEVSGPVFRIALYEGDLVEIGPLGGESRTRILSEKQPGVALRSQVLSAEFRQAVSGLWTHQESPYNDVDELEVHLPGLKPRIVVLSLDGPAPEEEICRFLDSLDQALIREFGKLYFASYGKKNGRFSYLVQWWECLAE